jgi:hypothetical protein
LSLAIAMRRRCVVRGKAPASEPPRPPRFQFPLLPARRDRR